MRTGASWFVAVAVLAALAANAGAQRIQVRDRARLGNGIEDVTFADSGTLAGSLVWVDGEEIKVAPEKDRRGKKDKTLVGVASLPVKAAPRGLTFLSPEQGIAVFDTAQPDRFFVLDERGRLTDTRTISYLPGGSGASLENAVYLPASAPLYPDRIVLANNGAWGAKLEVMTRAGQVETEIIPDEPLASNYICGTAYLAPGRLLASMCEPDLYVLDMTGHLLATITVPGVQSIEGIVQLPDGRVIAAEYGAGRLFAFDAALGRLPGDDRSYQIGLGLPGLRGLAWDTDAGRFLLQANGSAVANPGVWDLDVKLDDATLRVAQSSWPDVLLSSGTTYLPDEHRTCVLHRSSPRALQLFDAGGTLVETIGLGWMPEVPRGVEYIPGLQQFVISTRRTGDGTAQLQFVDRAGALLRTVELAPHGIAGAGSTAFFDPADPSGGTLMFFGNLDGVASLVVTDLDGNVLSSFDPRATLGIVEPSEIAAIATGKYAGSFAAVSYVNAEIVIFEVKQ